jgi:Zn-dependent protease
VNWWFIAVLIPSIVVHEVSHGWVANFFGDPTARQAGRLTLNPLKHIDPLGSIVLPTVLVFLGIPPFGWAKPVPVNTSRLRNPRQQSLYVSLAGPLVNVILSAIGLGLCIYSFNPYQYPNGLFMAGVYIGVPNLTLAVFNLLPIPPLDGSAIVERFVPQRRMRDYYALRAKALPFVMGFVILDNFSFHILGRLLGDVINWWYSLAT